MYLRIDRGEIKKHNVPRWLTKVNISPGSSTTNTSYVSGKHFKYKIVYYVPAKNFEGNPQNFGHVYDDYVDGELFRMQIK